MPPARSSTDTVAERCHRQRRCDDRGSHHGNARLYEARNHGGFEECRGRQRSRLLRVRRAGGDRGAEDQARLKLSVVVTASQRLQRLSRQLLSRNHPGRRLQARDSPTKSGLLLLFSWTTTACSRAEVDSCSRAASLEILQLTHRSERPRGALSKGRRALRRHDRRRRPRRRNRALRR